MKASLLLLPSFLVPLAAWAASANVAADAYISSANPTLNFANATTLNIGGGNSALIGLDLSSLPAGLTASNIQKATLTVFANKAFTAGGLDIAQVTGPWQESLVTYNNRPIAATPFQSNVPVSVSGSYVTFDITLLMRQWVTGAAANYGVEIRASVAQPNTAVALDSKESTSTSHPPVAEVILVSVGPQGPTRTPRTTGTYWRDRSNRTAGACGAS